MGQHIKAKKPENRKAAACKRPPSRYLQRIQAAMVNQQAHDGDRMATAAKALRDLVDLVRIEPTTSSMPFSPY